MALIVEDGTGLSTAQAYVSVADADTYNTEHEDDVDWSSATTADKEKALKLAAQAIDANYGFQWLGRRANESQALDWPRADVIDHDGYSIESTTVPQKLKDANVEMAIRQVRLADALVQDIEETGDIIRERVKVDTIEEEFEYGGAKGYETLYTLVDRLLARLTDQSGRTLRA